MKPRKHLVLAWAVAAALWAAAAQAGILRDRIVAHRAQQEQGQALDDGSEATGPLLLPAEGRVLRDVAYGSDPKQRMNVYLPEQARNAPVIFMVHGGGWRRGDKAMKAVVENKVKRWVSRGFILVSANYRLLPQADPVEQARDVAHALAAAQEMAASWGGDRRRFVLAGHSAGAHLVALLAASPSLTREAGAQKALGSVLLDSAALDVVQIMQSAHMRLYDEAFGTDPGYWKAASPYHVMEGAAQPVLAVCSTRRSDSCAQAARFVAKARRFGTRAEVLEEDLSHRDINQELGRPGAYTDAVEHFLATLDAGLAHRLQHAAAGQKGNQ